MNISQQKAGSQHKKQRAEDGYMNKSSENKRSEFFGNLEKEAAFAMVEFSLSCSAWLWRPLDVYEVVGVYVVAVFEQNVFNV